MGLSHLAIVNAQPDLEVAAVCDASSIMRGVLEKYTGVATYDDYDRMLREVELDAVLIATPSRTHASMVRAALDRGLHVFCEKPFTLNVQDAAELAALARSKGLVTQVGYHNRFVGPFEEVKRLLDAGAIGTVTHALGEAYGPGGAQAQGRHVAQPQGGGRRRALRLRRPPPQPAQLVLRRGDRASAAPSSSRSSRARPTTRCTARSTSPAGRARNISVNWSDESHRKMTTRITVWGTAGRIFADRQEIQVFLRDGAAAPGGLRARLERPLRDRAHGRGRVLPARRGVQRADRALRRAGRVRAGSTASTASRARPRPTA